VVPQPNWLPPLLTVFREFPDAGAVVGTLVSRDGQVNEAGVIVFSDGSMTGFGNGEYAVDLPLYNFVRPVESGGHAILAVKKELFLAIGGFDSRYRNRSYAVVDLCFRLARKNYVIYHQPQSRAVQIDDSDSVKASTEGSGDRTRLSAAHRRSLKNCPARPADLVNGNWYRLAVATSEGGSRG
jgi:GT2 family glycosyltransferase